MWWVLIGFILGLITYFVFTYIEKNKSKCRG